MQIYTVGPHFKGVKMLPPGPHFLGYSAVSTYGDVAPVTWFFLSVKTSQVVVRAWDTATELLVPLQDQDEVGSQSYVGSARLCSQSSGRSEGR